MSNLNEFRFNSGRLSLDLAATLRRRASQPMDVLSREGASSRWLRDAGLAHSPLPLSQRQEAELKVLRESIWAVASASTEGSSLPVGAIRTLNHYAMTPPPAPQLKARSGEISFVAKAPFQASLSIIARDAIELLGGPWRSRIKTCAQPDCGMLFLDMSRSSRRRWCSMDRCGSRAKGEAFRQRHAGSK